MLSKVTNNYDVRFTCKDNKLLNIGFENKTSNKESI